MGHDLHFLPLSNSCRIRLPCLQYYLIPGKTYESYYTPKSVPYPVDGTPCAGPNKVKTTSTSTYFIKNENTIFIFNNFLIVFRSAGRNDVSIVQ